ncbi:MAG: homocysteine biosynthesis protein [Actinomycetia bacterium]|nr:homocysteine biosynthesis protein [Actinomycetes bacterium]
MTIKKTYEEINNKIQKGEAVVLTAEQMVDFVKENGVKKAAEKVDIVTTGTFGPMCSSGAFINVGHSEPPIKIAKAWLNDVPAYAGLAAVDLYIGATELSETKGFSYGGAHVIEDLINKKPVKLIAEAYGTDCYPKEEVEVNIRLKDINQAYLFNPRNVYQNYAGATNSTKKTLYTYMGTLLPKYGNVNYCSAAQLSPLINDPYYRTIGIGTRIFLAGAIGYVSWEGTQHAPSKERNKNGIPTSPSGTLALIGNLKHMTTEFIRAASFYNYGTSIYVGVGIPIPILDEELAKFTSVSDEEIQTGILDYGVASRSRPVIKKVSYKELRSGTIALEGKKVSTAPLSSYKKARDIAENLKSWIEQGSFLLQKPLEKLSVDEVFKPLNIEEKEGG